MLATNPIFGHPAWLFYANRSLTAHENWKTGFEPRKYIACFMLY
jgi:hypothetical protein